MPSILLRTLTRVVTLILLGLPLGATDRSEYEVKAAFLVNFTHFVEWSDSTSAGQFTLCVVGPDPFGNSLEKVVGSRTVNDKPIVIKRFSRTIDGAPCQIAFFGDLDRNALLRLVRVPELSHSLTVGDSPGFAEHYGVIGFVLENNRVGLALNTARAAKAGLKINSQLTRVARIVSGDSGEARP
jgi:YfiR/HmsC-like